MPDIKKDNLPIEKGQPGKNFDTEKEVPGKSGMGENQDVERNVPGKTDDFDKQGSSEDKGYTRK